jgi:hypothetical protein
VQYLEFSSGISVALSSEEHWIDGLFHSLDKEFFPERASWLVDHERPLSTRNPYSGETPMKATIPIDNPERLRLERQHEGQENWRLWGPYLAERAWGTVREDYSAHGEAWEHLDHDQSRSRVYRWNEDGLGGICDEQQRLCFALALWNGRDPILKERAFGLTGNQGNHGEDVKEYYFYLDATPSHSCCAICTNIRKPNIPTAGWWRKTAAGVAKTRRSTCWIPASFRTTVTGMWR